MMAHTSDKAFADSKTVTSWPFRARAMAAPKPPKPAPLMMILRGVPLVMFFLTAIADVRDEITDGGDTGYKCT